MKIEQMDSPSSSIGHNNTIVNTKAISRKSVYVPLLYFDWFSQDLSKRKLIGAWNLLITA